MNTLEVSEYMNKKIIYQIIFVFGLVVSGYGVYEVNDSDTSALSARFTASSLTSSIGGNKFTESRYGQPYVNQMTKRIIEVQEKKRMKGIFAIFAGLIISVFSVTRINKMKQLVQYKSFTPEQKQIEHHDKELLSSIRRGDFKRVKSALHNGANPYFKIEGGRTLYELAKAGENTAVIGIFEEFLNKNSTEKQ